MHSRNPEPAPHHFQKPFKSLLGASKRRQKHGVWLSESGDEKLLVETGAPRYFPRFAAASAVMFAAERVLVPWTTPLARFERGLP